MGGEDIGQAGVGLRGKGGREGGREEEEEGSGWGRKPDKTSTKIRMKTRRLIFLPLISVTYYDHYY